MSADCFANVLLLGAVNHSSDIISKSYVCELVFRVLRSTLIIISQANRFQQ